MRVLVGKTFGIGNAVMSVPMIRALRFAGHSVDVLIGDTADDRGADAIFRRLLTLGLVGRVWEGTVAYYNMHYDVAIMAIPFDGRWQNGVHFKAKRVLDGRTRPDPSTEGLVSWKKHEVEYQMENAYELGFEGKVPSMGITCHPVPDPFTYYLGIGYKRDAAGFWRRKHWGNDNFIELARMILQDDERNRVIVTGDKWDLRETIIPIIRGLDVHPRFSYMGERIDSSIDVVLGCGTYVGNDTGMMHVAASGAGLVCGLFFMEGSQVKNCPWTENQMIFEGTPATVSPADVFHAIKERNSR